MSWLRAPRRPPRRAIPLWLAALLLGACGGESAAPTSGGGGTTATPPGPAAKLVLVSGDAQEGAANSTLAQPLVVRVTDANDIPVPNVNVYFGTGGDAEIVNGQAGTPPLASSTRTVATDGNGRASIQFRLGAGPGIYGLSAKLGYETTSPIVFFKMTVPWTASAFVARVAVGSGPQGVTVNAQTNTVYVGNTSLAFGCEHVQRASDPTPGSGSVTVIDGATLQTRQFTTANRPIYVTANPRTNRLYVAGTPALEVWDGIALTRLALTDLTGSLHQVAIDGARDEIWSNSTDAMAPAIKLLDGRTNAAIAAVTTGSKGSHGLAINPTTHRLYTTDLADRTVSVIDGITRQKVATITLPTSTLGVAVNATTNRVYVTSGSEMPSRVYVIDGATNTLLTTVPIGARGLLDLDVDETRNRIYVASQTMPFGVLTLDGATHTVLGFTPTDRCPFAPAIDPVRQRLYVTSYADNTVTVLDALKLP